MVKTINTLTEKKFMEVKDSREAYSEKKKFEVDKINYEVVRYAVPTIISLFGEMHRNCFIDQVILSLKNKKYEIRIQTDKGIVTKKTRANKKLHSKLVKLNECNIGAAEREAIEIALQKYCKIILSTEEALMLQIDMDNE